MQTPHAEELPCLYIMGYDVMCARNLARSILGIPACALTDS